MKASAPPNPPIGRLAGDPGATAAPPTDLGLARLSLMVGAIFDRLTAVAEDQPRQERTG